MSALEPCHDSTFGPAVSGCPHRFDFTLLFEDVILTIPPLLLLIILATFRLCQLPRQERVVSGLLFRSVKQVLLIAYLGVQITLLTLWCTTISVTNNTSIATAALSVSGALTLCVLSWFEHDRNIRPSTIAVVYLGFNLLTGIVKVRTLWYVLPHSAIATTMISSVVLTSSCLLLEVVEKRRYFLQPRELYGPERSSGIVSISLYFWLNSLFIRGSRTRLTLRTLPQLDPDMSAKNMGTYFAKNWEQITRDGGNEYTIIKSASIVLWRQIIAPIPFRLAFLGFTVCQPILIQKLLDYLAQSEDEQSNSHGHGLIVAYAIVYIGMAISFGLYWYYSFAMLTRLRAFLVSALGQRSAKLDMSSIMDPQAVLTLMSADVERTVDGLRGLHEAWANVLQVGIALYLLQRQVGTACVAPVALTIVISLIVIWISSKTKGRQNAWMEAIQKRIATTSAMLSSLKDVKEKGLEDAFSRLVTDLRCQEIDRGNRFRRVIAYAGVLSFIPEFMGPFITFAVLAFAPQFGRISLDATRVFTSFSAILLLAQPLAVLFSLLPMLLSAFACLNRMGVFLLKDDQVDPWTTWSKPAEATSPSDVTMEVAIQEKMVVHTTDVQACSTSPLPTRGELFKMTNCSFGWMWDKTVLHDINLSIYSGQLTAITGPVGCGKSTLCETLLGQTKLISGRCWLDAAHNNIAYCSQTPYLTNTSIKNNVIGSMDYDEQWYRKSLHLSELVSEVEDFAGKDNFVVGSNGAKLSGGQRQRLALARAIYSRCKVVVLDDVFSSIDMTKSKQVLENLFGSNGIFRLQNQTVIMVSHLQDYLSLAEHVVTLDKTGSVARDEQRHISTESLDDELILEKEGSQVGELPLTADIEDDRTRNPHGLLNETGTTNKPAPPVSEFVTYKYYVRSVGPFQFVLLVFFCVGLATCFNYGTIWLRNWTNHNARYGDTRNGYYLGVYAVFQAMTILCLGAAVYQALQEVVARSGRQLHGVLLHAVLGAPISFLTTTDSGELVNRFSQDMQLVDGELPRALMNLLLCLATAIGQVVLIIVTSPWTGLAFVPLIIILYIIQKFYLRTSKQIRLLDLESKSPLYTYFMESLKGMSTIRAFGWTYQRQRRLDRLLDDSQKPFYLLFMVQQWLALVLDLVVAGIAVIIVTAAIYLKSVASSTGVALIQIMSLNAVMRQIIVTWTQMESCIGAVSRVRGFGENTPSELGVHTYKEPPSNWPSNGEIEFCNVHASYEASSGPNVLHEVNLRIKSHETIGLCGHSGSGKSSLCLTLLRMTSVVAGSIFVDGIDIGELSPKTVRTNINVIPQDPIFMPLSVRENFHIMGQESVSDDAIADALQIVGLWHIVQAGGGLDVEVTANMLSQGQKQLFSLACALVRSGNILVLDEFTSSIDHETDHRMQEVIRHHFNEATVIIIAHRLDTITRCDRICVLQDGRIVEVGKPEELLQNAQSAFRRLRGEEKRATL